MSHKKRLLYIESPDIVISGSYVSDFKHQVRPKIYNITRVKLLSLSFQKVINVTTKNPYAFIHMSPIVGDLIDEINGNINNVFGVIQMLNRPMVGDVWVSFNDEYNVDKIFNPILQVIDTLSIRLTSSSGSLITMDTPMSMVLEVEYIDKGLCERPF